MGQHCVIIHFVDYGERFPEGDSFDLSPLHDFEDELEEAVAEADVGEHDGHEIEANSGRDGTIYLYGPDAEAIYDAILAVVVASPIARGGQFYLRFGEPNEAGVREEWRPVPIAPS